MALQGKVGYGRVYNRAYGTFPSASHGAFMPLKRHLRAGCIIAAHVLSLMMISVLNVRLVPTADMANITV
ncbi:hypothetical protein BV916_21760 [Pectobacterium odoriferum]|nr:hypothetical protein BV916_21760 [Pectobacterium odoriferum]